jgi:hypothetical protein
MEKAKAPAAIWTLLAEQFTLITALVAYTGIVATEGYYAAFNLPYQFLTLPFSHLLYRGITAIFIDYWLALPYLVALAWFSIDNYAIWRRAHRKFELIRVPVTYGVILALIVSIYLLAQKGGIKQARQEMRRDSRALPTIQCIMRKENPTTCDPQFAQEEERLLIFTDSFIVLFTPLADGQSLPHTTLLNKENIYAIKIRPSD